MKILCISFVISLACLLACQDVKIGYLKTGDAEYAPDTLFIYPKESLDPTSLRYQNNAPWVSSVLQGFSGTKPILFSIERVESTAGEAAAVEFKEDLTINGDGSMYYPLEYTVPAGAYVISIRLTNEGYSHVLEDVYTFIVTE